MIDETNELVFHAFVLLQLHYGIPGKDAKGCR